VNAAEHRLGLDSSFGECLLKVRFSAVIAASPNGRYGPSARESHSGLMLPARTTLAHFSISSAIRFP
jgi:hypothetical protein